MPIKRKWATRSECVIVPLKQHILSETNHMLSPLSNDTLISQTTRSWYGRCDTIRSCFMRARTCMSGPGWLFNLPIWARLHRLFWLPLAFPLKRPSVETLAGAMQILNCKSRALYFNQAHTVCSRVEQMLFNLHPYHWPECWKLRLTQTLSHRNLSRRSGCLLITYHNMRLLMPRSWATTPWRANLQGGKRKPN